MKIFSALYHYFRHLFLGEIFVLDEAGNVILLEGSPRFSISAHCGSQFVLGRPCKFCQIICRAIQRGLGTIWHSLRTHCVDSWNTEKAAYDAQKKGA